MKASQLTNKLRGRQIASGGPKYYSAAESIKYVCNISALKLQKKKSANRTHAHTIVFRQAFLTDSIITMIRKFIFSSGECRIQKYIQSYRELHDFGRQHKLNSRIRKALYFIQLRLAATVFVHLYAAKNLKGLLYIRFMIALL